jgi:hypothetical protein
VLEDGGPDKAGEMIQQLTTLRSIGVQVRCARARGVRARLCIR